MDYELMLSADLVENEGWLVSAMRPFILSLGQHGSVGNRLLDRDRGTSPAVRAPALHAGCREFESLIANLS